MSRLLPAWNRIVGVLLPVAALAKSFNLTDTQEVFDFFRVGAVISVVLALLLVCFEMWLGTWLVVSGRSHRASIMTLLAFGVFTAVLVYFYFHAEAPDCNCTGLLKAAADAKQSHLHGIILNTIILGTGGVLLALHVKAGRRLGPIA